MKTKNNKMIKPTSFKMYLLDNKKLKYIALLEERDLTGQLNYIVRKYIEQYEKETDILDNEEYQSLLKNVSENDD